MVVIACVILLTGLTLLRPRLALLYLFFSFSFEQLLRTRAPDVVTVGAASLLPPVRFSQIVTIVLFGMLLLTWLRRLRLPRPGLVFWLFALYAGVCLVSVSYSRAAADSARQMLIIVLIGLTSVTVAGWVRDMVQARALIRAIYWGVVLHCLWALFQILCYTLFGLELGYYAPRMADFLKARTFGWMFEPNWLGLMLVAVFPWFLLALDYGHDLGISRKAAFFGLGALALTLLLNMSRLAWLAVAFQAVVWACASLPHLRRYLVRGLIWAVPLTVAALCFIYLGPPGLRQSLVDRFADLALISEGRGSANVRLYNYEVLLGLYEKQPWLGYGVGTWGALSGLSAFGAGPTTTFLYVLVEVGIVGLVPFLLAILALAWRLLARYRQSQGPARMYALAALLSVAGMCVSAWFVDVKSALSYFPIFGLYLAVARLLRPALVVQAAPAPALVVGRNPA